MLSTSQLLAFFFLELTRTNPKLVHDFLDDMVEGHDGDPDETTFERMKKDAGRILREGDVT